MFASSRSLLQYDRQILDSSITKYRTKVAFSFFKSPSIIANMAGGKSALIFGASGVTGWAFVNEILNDYPKKGTWTKVHALTNRPLTLEDSNWPQDSRLNIVSGIDLLQGSQEELEKVMKEKIEGVEKVTHVYYLAYKANKDQGQEIADAIAMFKRSTIAMDKLSPALEFVVLQTGAKMCA